MALLNSTVLRTSRGGAPLLPMPPQTQPVALRSGSSNILMAGQNVAVHSCANGGSCACSGGGCAGKAQSVASSGALPIQEARIGIRSAVPTKAELLTLALRQAEVNAGRLDRVVNNSMIRNLLRSQRELSRLLGRMGESQAKMAYALARQPLPSRRSAKSWCDCSNDELAVVVLGLLLAAAYMSPPQMNNDYLLAKLSQLIDAVCVNNGGPPIFDGVQACCVPEKKTIGSPCDANCGCPSALSCLDGSCGCDATSKISGSPCNTDCGCPAGFECKNGICVWTGTPGVPCVPGGDSCKKKIASVNPTLVKKADGKEFHVCLQNNERQICLNGSCYVDSDCGISAARKAVLDWGMAKFGPGYDYKNRLFRALWKGGLTNGFTVDGMPKCLSCPNTSFDTGPVQGLDNLINLKLKILCNVPYPEPGYDWCVNEIEIKDVSP